MAKPYISDAKAAEIDRESRRNGTRSLRAPSQSEWKRKILGGKPVLRSGRETPELEHLATADPETVAKAGIIAGMQSDDPAERAVSRQMAAASAAFSTLAMMGGGRNSRVAPNWYKAAAEAGPAVFTSMARRRVDPSGAQFKRFLSGDMNPPQKREFIKNILKERNAVRKDFRLDTSASAELLRTHLQKSGGAQPVTMTDVPDLPSILKMRKVLKSDPTGETVQGLDMAGRMFDASFDDLVRSHVPHITQKDILSISHALAPAQTMITRGEAIPTVRDIPDYLRLDNLPRRARTSIRAAVDEINNMLAGNDPNSYVGTTTGVPVDDTFRAISSGAHTTINMDRFVPYHIIGPTWTRSVPGTAAHALFSNGIVPANTIYMVNKDGTKARKFSTHAQNITVGGKTFTGVASGAAASAVDDLSTGTHDPAEVKLPVKLPILSNGMSGGEFVQPDLSVLRNRDTGGEYLSDFVGLSRGAPVMFNPLGADVEGTLRMPVFFGGEASVRQDAKGGNAMIKRNGNLKVEGRRRMLVRDGQGRVEEYGTTGSVTEYDPQSKSYVVIPTIVDGKKLSRRDAFAHYRDTGEFWHRAPTIREANQAANEVHAESQDRDNVWWQNYLADHYDDGTLGPVLRGKLAGDAGFQAWRNGYGAGELPRMDPGWADNELHQDALGGDADMAAEEQPQEDGPRIVINPSVFEDDKDALCVAFNEAFRIIMEMNGFEPQSEPTEAQRRFFADTPYANDELQLRRTILARICTFDTSIS